MNHEHTPSVSTTRFPAESLLAGVLLFTLGMGAGAAIGMSWVV